MLSSSRRPGPRSVTPFPAKGSRKSLFTKMSRESQNVLWLQKHMARSTDCKRFFFQRSKELELLCVSRFVDPWRQRGGLSINALRWHKKEAQTRLSMPVCKRLVQRNWPEIGVTFDEVFPAFICHENLIGR